MRLGEFMYRVIKRDGKYVDFDLKKISIAIEKAFEAKDVMCNKDILELQKSKLEEKYNAKIILLDVANIDISSSMIRERIAEGRRVDFFLPEGVMKYISENNLYRRE